VTLAVVSVYRLTPTVSESLAVLATALGKTVPAGSLADSLRSSARCTGRARLWTTPRRSCSLRCAVYDSS